MTSFKYYLGASIDGFIADSAGETRWLEPFGDAQGALPGFQKFFDEVGAIVIGGQTYLWLVKQLTALERPWPYAGKPVWVFTHHELPSTPGADLTFVRGDIDLWSHDIARSAGQQDVWILGGAQLAGRFLTAGVLDELQLLTVPVVLGSGVSVFDTKTPADFTLIDRTVHENGVLEDRYRVAVP